MVSKQTRENIDPNLYRVEQLCISSEHLIPKDCLNLDVLKSLEIELQTRGIVLNPLNFSVHPFWFVAETERNVFLWRNGLSLDKKDYFEFWVNVRKLGQKRLDQISRYDLGNPFLNSNWGDQDSAQSKESEYLQTFIDVISKIELHAHALSRVGSMLARELSGIKEERRIIVLPC